MATKKYTDEELRERKNARQREYQKRTKGAAAGKYNKEHMKQYAIRFDLVKDSDVITKLDNCENKTAYIRDLIRADIAFNGELI